MASEDADNLAQLEGRVLPLKSMAARDTVESPTKILETVGIDAFGDRLEGVALLAEALNSSSPLGRYSQLIRLFE
ncbi:MAG: hypothetical protein LC775_01440, partial [Acidobacteria bacterium]|nr:hypothetical protein [Acidobacteriota bacterium]